MLSSALVSLFGVECLAFPTRFDSEEIVFLHVVSNECKGKPAFRLRGVVCHVIYMSLIESR